MISITDDIAALLEWFYLYAGHYNNQALRDFGPKFLCLFVGRTLKDANLFKEVFSHREVLDTVTGKHLLVFLFVNGQESRIEITPSQHSTITPRQTTGGKNPLQANRIIIPGEVLDSRSGTGSHMMNYGIPSTRFFPITDIPDEYHEFHKESIVSGSFRASTKIIEHFGLSMDNIPCLLILSGNREQQPLAVRTRNRADIQSVYQLLLDLRNCIDYEIKHDSRHKMLEDDYSEFEYQKAEYSKLNLEKSSLEADLSSYVKESQEILQNYGISKSIANQLINSNNAIHIWVNLGLNRHEQKTTSLEEYDEITRAVANNTEFKKVFRKVFKISKQLKTLSGKIDERRAGVMRYRKELEKSYKEYLKSRQDIDEMQEVVKKYEKRYKLRSLTYPIADFLRKLVGVSKAAKNTLDLEEKIEELLK